VGGIKSLEAERLGNRPLYHAQKKSPTKNNQIRAVAGVAAAMQAYGRMANDKTLEVDAAEIRIRAVRRLGEMLAAQKADGGLNSGAQGNPGGQGAKLVPSSQTSAQPPKLSDAGISYDLSSRSQKLNG
jgi:hypothetical protein